jgi:hypothetical protein
MATRITIILICVLGFAAILAISAWLASLKIESPADAAARAAPPTPSPILVPVENRILSSNIVTRGTTRFGLPQPISIAPSSLKAGAGLITTLPLPSTQLEEGAVMLTASGRPLFVLRGKIPVFRDLVPGISGDDVRQLEQALERLGFAPGRVDGTYDQQTSMAVTQWYRSTGWEPFGPTQGQLAKVQALEYKWDEARKGKVAAAAAAVTAGLAVESARAAAEHNIQAATAELATRQADWLRLTGGQNKGRPSALETARAMAEYNNKVAAAEAANQAAARALIVLDPRQPETARKKADTKLELARAAARKTQMEGELAVQTVQREARLATEQLELAQAALKSIRLEGEKTVQAAIDTLQVAEFDAQLTAERADQLAVRLESTRSKVGMQVPADEIVFLPALPVRVKEVTVNVGDPARGRVLSVTDNQLVIDSSLPLDAAQLVKPGMPVAIDEQALGVKATGVVEKVAPTPGTQGVDGYHIYFKVRVVKTSTRLEGFSLRLTIPIESSNGAVTVVPLNALSLSADGKSRVRVENNGTLEYIVVKPGLAADGFVEVTPLKRSLNPGQLVVVGYKNSEE